MRIPHDYADRRRGPDAPDGGMKMLAYAVAYCAVLGFWVVYWWVGSAP